MDFKNLYIAKTDRSDFVLEAAYEKAEEVLLDQTVPNPIPIMVLGRLAIDQNYRGQGLGDALLRDALLRILQAADIAGIKAIVVHAISEQAKAFTSFMKLKIISFSKTMKRRWKVQTKSPHYSPLSVRL